MAAASSLQQVEATAAAGAGAAVRDPLPLRVECKILAGDVEMVFIELGCESDSELSEAVRDNCFAVRVTKQYDLTQRGSKGAITASFNSATSMASNSMCG